MLLQVFSEQPLLHDALAQSDRALAVVKDLFGDAPRRQTGECFYMNSLRLYSFVSRIFVSLDASFSCIVIATYVHLQGTPV